MVTRYSKHFKRVRQIFGSQPRFFSKSVWSDIVEIAARWRLDYLYPPFSNKSLNVHVCHAEGDFSLAVSTTHAVLPPHDTCESATEILFAGQTSAGATSTSIYSLDDYYPEWCLSGAGGPDVVYKFDAPSGKPIGITLDADFDAMMVLAKGGCDPVINGVDCGTTNIQKISQTGGTYYLFIEGVAPMEWGDYTVSVSFD